MIPTDALASGRSHQPCGNSRGTPSPSTDDEIIDVLSMPSSAVRSSWPTCRLGARYLGPARFEVASPCGRRQFQRMSVVGVRREKAALSSGCKSHPATAPAGSNRSSYGGNEVAEAFGKRVTKYGDSASV